MTRLSRWWAQAFDGEADARVLWVVRTVIAAAALVRTSDVLRPLVALDHHRWVHGLEFAPWSEPTSAPRLAVGLMPGLGVLLAPAIAGMLVVLRTTSALALLVGVVPRASALVLGLSGYALMAADRSRYLHHTHLLWTSCLLLALVPWRAEPMPKWPVTLLRFQVLVIYAASGLAKLDPSWLDGSTLTTLAGAGLVTPALLEVIDAPLLAPLICAIELLLVPLLLWPRTRAVSVALAITFHLGTDVFMMVSTFPVVMIALVLTFAPSTRRRPMPPASSRDGADALDDLPDPAGRDERLLLRREP